MARFIDPRVRRGGAVRFDPDRGASIVALLMAPPERSGGVGGWQRSERQRRRSASWFGAQPDDTMSLEIAFDANALPGDRTIEQRLRVLREMGTAEGGQDPPSIEISGDIWDFDQGLDWVMEDMSLGERVFYSDGEFLRQHVTVAFVRFQAIDEIDAVKIRPTRGKNSRRRRTVTSRGGDTLRAVSLRELGSPSRWQDLRKWNKVLSKTNPDDRLRTGTKIVIR